MTGTFVSDFYKLECEIRQLKDFRDEDARIKHELRQELKEITSSCDLWFKDTQKFKQKLFDIVVKNDLKSKKLEKIEDRLKDVPMMITYEELPDVIKGILKENQ